METVKRIGIFYAFALLIVLASCSAKDNSNELINTQFALEIQDHSHVLSPKTYSYLKNFNPPLGVKPVVVAIDQIEDEEIGALADDLFEEYCKKEYSGNTFKQRGVLLVVSKNPELVQIRVGKTYDIYCRMKGSAAGADYLKMQQEIEERGIDEMCPIALNNVLHDIEECRQLPWYKRIALKISIIHLEKTLSDVATPSKSFFSKFYFRPFLYIVGGVKSIFGNWILSFLFISIFYILTKGWLEKQLNAYVNRKAHETSNTKEEYETNLILYDNIRMIGVFLVKLIITVPTLAAISVLSTSRMEDIIALRYAHIPSVDIVENVTHWSNNTPTLWLVLLLIIVYYFKFLFCGKGYFSFGNMPDNWQRRVSENGKTFHDLIINKGYNRNSIQMLFGGLLNTSFSAAFSHNFHELITDTVQQDNYETDDEGRPQKRLIDYGFLDSDSPLYRQSPFLAILINTHREAICLAFFVGLGACVVLSYTYALYFFILWTVQLIYRITEEILFYMKNLKGSTGFTPFKIVKHIWKTDLVFLLIMGGLFLILAPSYTPKKMETITEVKQSLPDDFSGLYFVTKADGIDAKGTTARIQRSNQGEYFMQVYSEQPIRRFALELDAEQGVFHSDILGDGYIVYDKQANSIIINFSDLWVLTN